MSSWLGIFSSGKEEDDEDDESGWREVRDGSAIGPFGEGEEIALKCSAGGGRPIPEVRVSQKPKTCARSGSTRH